MTTTEIRDRIEHLKSGATADHQDTLDLLRELCDEVDRINEDLGRRIDRMSEERL